MRIIFKVTDLKRFCLLPWNKVIVPAVDFIWEQAWLFVLFIFFLSIIYMFNICQGIDTTYIEAFSQLLTAFTAVIMAILAYKTYLKTPEQKPELNTHSDTNTITVFQTSRQKTQLKITPSGLECHLIDNKTGQDNHEWTINYKEAQQILEENDIYIDYRYKLNSGAFNIGDHRRWLYSKNIYMTPEELNRELIGLLKKIKANK